MLIALECGGLRWPVTDQGFGLGFATILPARFRAILYFIPVALPLLTPRKWAPTDST
jgi:hypothetical protein